MITLGVLADTHVPDRTRGLNPEILNQFKMAGVAAILHAGDVTTPGILAELADVAPVYAVRGNRDWFSLRHLPDSLKLNFNGVDILLTHGHGGWINYFINWGRYLSQGYQPEVYLNQIQRSQEAAPVTVFGHTHRPLVKRLNGRLFFNPGSAHGLDVPWLPPSLGLLSISDRGGVTSRHIWMD